MTVVTIESAKHRAQVEELLADVAMHDPNWNGAEFSVEVGDCMSIDTDDEIAGAALMSRLRDAVAGVP